LFLLLDNIDEQKCRAILDLDTMEDMEVHHHSSTRPSQTTTLRRIRGALFSGISVDLFADLRITAHPQHREDMATNSLPHTNSLTATLR
jgi:hypothetical protein